MIIIVLQLLGIVITTLWHSFLLKLCYFIYQAARRAWYFRNYPTVPGSLIIGNIRTLSPNFPFPTSKGTPLLDAVKFYTELYPCSFFVQWLFYYPVIVATDYELVYTILANRENIEKGIAYTFLEEAFSEGLLTSNGNKWRYRRKLIEPTIGLRMLPEFISTMVRHTVKLIESLEKRSSKVLDLSEEIDPTALKIILQTAMGLSDEYLNEHVDEHVKNSRLVTKHIVHRVRNPILWITPIRRIYEVYTGIDKVHREFRDFGWKVIQQKLQAKVDLLSGKMANNIDSGDEGEQTMIMKPGSRKMFIDLLIDKYFESLNDNNPHKIDQAGLYEEVQLLVFAGHDTTATTIKWTLYNLGLHPGIQEKLYQEVANFEMSEDNVDLNYLKNFTYLEQCINEGLRVRPTIPLVVRELEKDIDYKGYKFPKGSDVLVSLYSVHHNASVFPDPEKFDPERFSPENMRKIPSKAFLPFAAGPRKCLGKNYAMLEMKIIIAYMVKTFKIISEKPLNEIPFDFDMVSAARVPLIVTIERRRRSSEFSGPQSD